jgi:hypothetical protein
MLKKRFDNEPDPPSSGWQEVALLAFLISAAALVWWALFRSLLRTIGI